MIRRIALLLLVLGGTGCPALLGKTPGSRAGHGQGGIELTAGQVTATSVTAAGAPSVREGTLTTGKYVVGVYLQGTKLGSVTGIEYEIGLGYLSGAATSLEDGAATSSWRFESELGGVVQPLNVTPGPLQLRLVGDFGIGFNLDDRYTYAGGRAAIGAASRRVTLDGSARRHFGDTPGNPGAHEDRFRVTLTIRPGKKSRLLVHLGAELIRGDQRTLDAAGVEVARDDYLLRGRYEMRSLTLGFSSISTL